MDSIVAGLGSSKQTGGDGIFRPQLTSLIDVMTILLVFLIKSFSVEGNLVTPTPDLELPISTSRETPRPLPSVEITRSAVMSGGEVITSINEFASSDSLLIPRLYQWAETRFSPSDTTQTSNLMIQADQETEFNIIKRVMYTCGKAGVSDFTVLVYQEED